MSLHDFFIGGTALRVTVFAVGIAYCIHAGRGRSLMMLALCGSVVILLLLVFSREWATLLGVPVSILVVERLTEAIRLEAFSARQRDLLRDQHAVNEHLVAELAMRERHSNHSS